MSRKMLPGDLDDWIRTQRKNRERLYENERHESILRYLADHVPWAVVPVLECGRRVRRRYRDPGDPEWRKAVMWYCRLAPWCFPCSEMMAAQRTKHKLDAFYGCTPKGEEPTGWHIVVNPPVYRDGTGWGRRAAEQPVRLRRIVWRTMERLYGRGIGGVATYQDQGEKPFTGVLPHIELIVNGWRIADGKVQRTPRYDLENGGKKEWERIIVEYAQTIEMGASEVVTHMKPITGNFEGLLGYQMREIVNLRFWSYDRENQQMTYHSKRRGDSTIHVGAFNQGISEYQRRLGFWKKGQAVTLHAGYGYMADKPIKKAKRVIGGVAPVHRDDCGCSDCGDWEPDYGDE